jgi:hypothetical protein
MGMGSYVLICCKRWRGLGLGILLNGGDSLLFIFIFGFVFFFFWVFLGDFGWGWLRGVFGGEVVDGWFNIMMMVISINFGRVRNKEIFHW